MNDDAASSTSDPITDVRSVLWHNVAVRMTPAVQEVVEFAKHVPGFSTLPQDDQLILIKVIQLYVFQRVERYLLFALSMLINFCWFVHCCLYST